MEFSLVLCDDLEGWKGVGGMVEREEMCVLTADSLYCPAKANTTLPSSHPPIKK